MLWEKIFSDKNNAYDISRKYKGIYINESTCANRITGCLATRQAAAKGDNFPYGGQGRMRDSYGTQYNMYGGHGHSVPLLQMQGNNNSATRLSTPDGYCSFGV